MKVIVLVGLISMLSCVFAQPTMNGFWVSDSCEPIPGQVQQGFNYWYVRNYTFDGSAIELDIKIYQNTCAPNNLQAQIVSTGVFELGPKSAVATGCDINNTESEVYDIQFFYNTSRTITVSTNQFAIAFGSFCNLSLTVGSASDISTLNCKLFQLFYPCAGGEHDIISVIAAEGVKPMRFYNGVRSSDNLCLSLNRPTSLSLYACALNGTGVSTTPVTCTTYVAPVGSTPVATPGVTPVHSKQSIGSIVFTSSILVLAASIVAFF